MQKNLAPISQVLEGINKKVEGNFYCLISCLAGAVSLGVVGCTVK